MAAGGLKPGRDLRLDLFRGLALVFIFIDHVPGNRVAQITLGSLSYSDAAEVFVFISGYTAALVFGGMAERAGDGYAMLRMLQRIWTLYVAHVFLFMIFMAAVSYTAHRLANPMFLDETGVADFLTTPHLAVANALVLRFQPAFMDILPLYIVLLLVLLAALPLLRRFPAAVLAASFLLWIVAQRRGMNLTTFPSGTWFFNPLAWQFLFLIGAALAIPTKRPIAGAWLDSRALFWAAVAVAVVGAAGRLWLSYEYLFGLDLKALTRVLWWGYGKTNLGLYRLVDLLALALIVARLVAPDGKLVRSAAARPIVLCGQNSLYIFCLGIFLSFLGHLALVEVSSRFAMHVLVSVGGVAVMVFVAYAMKWADGLEARAAARARP